MASEINQLTKAVDYLRTFYQKAIDFGMILGSGLGSVTDSVQDGINIPFAEIPGWPVSTVKGHSGIMTLGNIKQKRVLIMKGRIHYYEGYSMQLVTYPIRVMQKMGIKNLIVTNAAGAVNPDFQPGDVMLITDHLNIMGMAGENPLRGKNFDELGPRFPDMSQAYNRRMMEETRLIAKKQEIVLKEGIYAGLSGPSFETPADLRFLRAIGADAVGMSTVPEVTVARHGNMNVLGFSGISNKANLDGTTETTHEEVLAAGDILAPKLEKIIVDFIGQAQ
ncbi:purine-nucleoside phosphorylase [Chloroflexota bacterium]